MNISVFFFSGKQLFCMVFAFQIFSVAHIGCKYLAVGVYTCFVCVYRFCIGFYMVRIGFGTFCNFLCFVGVYRLI